MTGVIRGVAADQLSSDIFATAGEGGGITVWSINSRSPVYHFSSEFDQGGKRLALKGSGLAVGSYRVGSIMLADTHSGEVRWRARVPRPENINLVSDLVIASGEGGTTVLDVANGEQMANYPSIYIESVSDPHWLIGYHKIGRAHV